MPELNDADLELIIYKIKKGMLLRPSESYRNNHIKHSSVRRSMKMVILLKKKTRKKRGGSKITNYDLLDDLDDNDGEYHSVWSYPWFIKKRF